MRLVGTTKPTIESIRGRTHWNANNLQPTDPVALGLCSQIDLDFEVEKAAKNAPAVPVVEGATLLPASETTTPAAALAAAALRPERSAEKEAADEASAVFAKLKSMKGPVADDDED
jgi:hypothetical protein